MTIHLVTFASKDMEQSSWLCAQSSKKHGAETHARFNPANISHFEEVKQHRKLFDQPKGCGYWAWKPLIIDRELGWLPEGSTLIYSDAGVEFIDNVHYIIDRMDQDIFLFGNNWEHAHWCKRDVIDEVWTTAKMVNNEYRDGGHFQGAVALTDDRRIDWVNFGKQVQASVIFFRVSDYSRAFVKEWLNWCLFEGGRLIDDSPSRTPNHPEFREHRHDQAILTTMAYRDGIKLHYWPAMYNDGAFIYEKLPEYARDDYPVLFHHHRRRNHEWEVVA